jgi:hypothetical protein
MTTAETTVARTALTDSSFPVRTIGQDFTGNYPGSLLVAAGTTLYQGHVYAIGAGSIVPILPSSTNDQHLLTVGLFDATIAVPAGSSTIAGDSATTYTCLQQVVLWANNDTTNPVTAANIGSLGYFINGETVANTAAAYSPIAGRIEELSSDGLLVKVNMAIRA